MELNDSLIANLQILGLTKWQAQIFVELTKLEIADASTLVSRTEIPDSKIYRVLEDLENKKIISSLNIGKRNKMYRVVPVKNALEVLTSPLTQAVAETDKALNSLYLSEKGKKEADKDYWIYMDSEILHSVTSDLIDRTNNEIVLFFTKEQVIEYYENIRQLKQRAKIKLLLEKRDLQQIEDQIGSIDQIASELIVIDFLDFLTSLRAKLIFKGKGIDREKMAANVTDLLNVRPKLVLTDPNTGQSEAIVSFKVDESRHMGIHVQNVDLLHFLNNLIGTLWTLFSTIMDTTIFSNKES